MIKPLAHKMLNVLMPLHCQLCQESVSGHPAICERCSDALPWLGSVCSVCSIAMPDGVSRPCGECQTSERAYNQVLALFEYAAPIDSLITRLKFGQQLSVARLLGELLVARLSQRQLGLADFSILPVPLHRQRLQERGYNQSLEIARPLARALQLPLISGHIERQQPTRAQSGLSAKARVSNLKGAFRVKEADLPRSVLILDDVITTGATINELAKTLHQAGVKHIEIAAIARAS